MASGNDLYVQAQQRIREIKTQLIGMDKNSPGYATALTQLLGAIAQAITNAPTADLKARWLAAYNAIRPPAATARANVSAAEAPSVALRQLDIVSDHVLKLADDVLVGAGGAARALPKVVTSLPFIIGALAVAAVVVGFIYYRTTVRRHA